MEEDLQEITVYIRKRGKSCVAKANLKRVAAAERSAYRPVTFLMRPLTWGANNRFLQRAKRVKVIRGLRISETDWDTYREAKFVWALTGWCGWEPPVPFSPEATNNLDPNVVDAILEGYDNLNYLSDEDEKTLALEVDNYLKSQHGGSKMLSPPPEIVERSLLEKYGWTPNQMDNIQLRRLQALFAASKQQEASINMMQEAEANKNNPVVGRG